MTQPTLTPEEENYLDLMRARTELTQRLTTEGVDIVQITSHPEWVALNEKIMAVPAAIRKRFTQLHDPKAYENIRHILEHARVHMDHRTGTVSLVGDGEPATGYLLPMEARTATKSMDENAEPLTNEEYAARKQQLQEANRELDTKSTDEELGKTLAYLLNNTPGHVAAAKRREYFLGRQKVGSKLPPPLVLIPDVHVSFQRAHDLDVSRILALEDGLKVRTPLLIQPNYRQILAEMGKDIMDGPESFLNRMALDKSQRVMKRPMPIRILGESEVRLLGRVHSRQKARIAKKHSIDRIWNTIYDAELRKADLRTVVRNKRVEARADRRKAKIQRRGLRGMYRAFLIHQFVLTHKGRKPKR